MDSNKLRRKYRQYQKKYLNQTKIGEMIGVKRVTVSLWLNGANCIGKEKLIKLEKLIDECN